MLEHEKLTKAVIGCAYKVYNHMGFGFLESVYEKCLLIEIGRAGLKAECQKAIPVTYDGQAVGNFSADIIIDNKVILELKSVKRLAKAHEIQLVNYLVATGISVGLLINFGARKVEVKRKLRNLNN